MPAHTRLGNRVTLASMIFDPGVPLPGNLTGSLSQSADCSK